MRPHISDKNARLQVIDQIVNIMFNYCEKEKLKIHEFAKIAEKIPIITLNLYKKNLSEGF
jgi:hypothetical protein